MSAHSPEPWTVSTLCVWSGDEQICDFSPSDCDTETCVQNAERAVKCVNALAGIPDPAAELARLRACEAALRGVMEWYYTDASDPGDMPIAIFDAAVMAMKGGVE